MFGALGGFIHSDLDYDAINRIFSFDGGQVGGYATYLRGGLFVDTLVNVHLMQLDTRTLGFPNPLNATTVGVRTDSGYRFGSFHGGAFIEPLATISVDWADIDGFSQGGNKVSFNNDANVQGRLGLRVGTTTQLGYGITAEPFVIGSLWGNLSNDNQATLVSTGTTFILEDHLQDVWGEVSGGVNFFNPTASHLRVRQGRCHLRPGYRRRRRQGRHARLLVAPPKGRQTASFHPAEKARNLLDFAPLPDHSPATCDAEGALWRRKKCSNSREW